MIVETVGVGQSETAVADMCDLFVLLASPGGGDDLQGIKRGVMELADLLIVTKSDGDLKPAANRAAADYHGALHLMRPKHAGLYPKVLQVSAVEGAGIAETWQEMNAIHATAGRRRPPGAAARRTGKALVLERGPGRPERGNPVRRRAWPPAPRRWRPTSPPARRSPMRRLGP